ncbi:MAG: hypothetical protein AB7V00_03410 [Bacilli bacterium]
MNFKEFEEKISNINNQIFAFFMQVGEEEHQKIDEVFQTLKQNLDQKKLVLNSFEQQLLKDEKDYAEKIQVFENDIANIIHEQPLLLYVLDDKKNFINQEKLEEQNKIISYQRRRRSEFAHRINTLNKDMQTLLKEHNQHLEDEEKNYKTREAELNRRMNIDLQKANDQTIKDCGDLEKLLLETNDPTGIADLKKKIVAFRANGFKEQESIKNKYEFSFIENTLEFKRFNEKISLDNALTVEDFSTKIKAIEKKRNDLELADKIKLALFGFELDKQYLEWEKEQHLFAIDWEINNFAKQIAVKQQIDDEMKNYYLNHLNKNKEYHQMAYDVDTTQLNYYRPLESTISNDVKKQCDYLLESLSDCIEVFQANLIAIVENTWDLKKRLRNDLSKYLLVAIKDELPMIESHYCQELVEIERFCVEYYKLQNKRFLNFLKAVSVQTNNLLQEVKATIAVFKNYYLEEQNYRQEMDKKISNELTKGFNYALLHMTNDFHHQEVETKNYQDKMEDEADKHRLSMIVKKQKVQENYQTQLNNLNEQIKKAELDHKRLIFEEENNYQLFIKTSKQKQSSLKRDFSDNLVNHERNLDKKYRLALQRNEKDRKSKIKAL